MTYLEREEPARIELGQGAGTTFARELVGATWVAGRIGLFFARLHCRACASRCQCHLLHEGFFIEGVGQPLPIPQLRHSTLREVVWLAVGAEGGRA